LLGGLGAGAVREGAIALLSKLEIEDEDLTVRSRAALAGMRNRWSWETMIMRQLKVLKIRTGDWINSRMLQHP
jgi:hypothetical protein